MILLGLTIGENSYYYCSVFGQTVIHIKNISFQFLI